uniref:AlNc14C171G8003 protein n=1 Tax=Albugo laibachii Nc14 TaxID=890382 RepID=F0WEI8_9STRA|nr:AlNc14C75G5039 [Albugo laibachii Nc14]CCA22870.1 AlNc14C171G8003 [Albugo laibachii Nc14]|eukprot:CCA22870.1 AlNc14C171G8003 [Albugo laibachii Nc14]
MGILRTISSQVSASPLQYVQEGKNSIPDMLEFVGKPLDYLYNLCADFSRDKGSISATTLGLGSDG